jgi:two-component system OmpR family response regulator
MPDPTSGPPEREPGRVLVVEDEEEANDELVWALVDAGFAVASARDGDQALAILEVSTFDLMILDLIMPRIGGIAVIEEVRKRELDLPIVLISEAIGLLDKHRFGEFGISHVVRKPLKMDALVALVRQVVGGRKSARRSGGSEPRKASC